MKTKTSRRLRVCAFCWKDRCRHRKVKAGDVLFVPAGTQHTATNIGSDNGAELATYIVKKGKPLIPLVK